MKYMIDIVSMRMIYWSSVCGKRSVAVCAATVLVVF